MRGYSDLDLLWVIDLEAANRPELAEILANQPGGSRPSRAVQEQLGLTSKKGRGEIMVIDHVAKAPVGN